MTVRKETNALTVENAVPIRVHETVGVWRSVSARHEVVCGVGQDALSTEMRPQPWPDVGFTRLLRRTHVPICVVVLRRTIFTEQNVLSLGIVIHEGVDAIGAIIEMLCVEDVDSVISSGVSRDLYCEHTWLYALINSWVTWPSFVRHKQVVRMSMQYDVLVGSNRPVWVAYIPSWYTPYHLYNPIYAIFATSISE